LERRQKIATQEKYSKPESLHKKPETTKASVKMSPLRTLGQETKRWMGLGCRSKAAKQ